MMFGGVAAAANDASKNRASEQRNFMGNSKRRTRRLASGIFSLRRRREVTHEAHKQRHECLGADIGESY